MHRGFSHSRLGPNSRRAILRDFSRHISIQCYNPSRPDIPGQQYPRAVETRLLQCEYCQLWWHWWCSWVLGVPVPGFSPLPTGSLCLYCVGGPIPLFCLFTDSWTRCNLLSIVVICILSLYFYISNRRAARGKLVIEGLPEFRYTL